MFFVTRLTQSELLHLITALINLFCRNLEIFSIASSDDFINAFYSYFIYCLVAILCYIIRNCKLKINMIKNLVYTYMKF